jgi:chemotaxis protein MotB
MSAENKPEQIIIVRKKVYHGSHHGGAWKVAYADFVTAMMALFIVLWLMSSSEKVKKAVGGYFADPTGVGKQVGTTLAGSGNGVTVTKDDMDSLKSKIEQALHELPKFDQVNNQVKVIVTNDGLRIELLETEKGLFFESGKAQPSDNGQMMLALLADQISKLPNKILIEGHTDAKPYSGDGGYSNWELSTDRANAARRFLMEHGLHPDQVRQVRGFADQNLLKPDNPADPTNRRISVIITYRDPVSMPIEQKQANPAEVHAPAGKPAESPAGKPSH